MFCPLCETEYRPGFTHCSDCNSVLVESIEPRRDPSERDRNESSATILWHGSDPVLLTRISSDLQDAGIPLHSQTEMDHKHMPHILLPMGLQYGKRGFRIFVRSDDLEKARALLADVLESPGVPQEYVLNERDEPFSAPSLVELDEYEETVQVWRGADRTLAKSIGDCLRENSIACRSEVSGSEATINVRLDDETQAREIIRQVLEGVPPD